MRILFALTVALGVSAPAFTTTTANSVGAHIDEVTPDHQRPDAQQISKPVGEIAVDGLDRELAPEASIGKALGTQGFGATQPTEAKQDDAALDAADPDDDEPLPVTVEIERVCEALADAANAQGLPIGFFARLIWQESRFDQWARSPAGARGVAQFMPPTAAEYGLQDPFDPIKSVAASARFLRQLRDQFGNLGLAAAAYNAGGGRIRKWLNGQSALPEETRNYVHVITGHPPQRWTVQRPLEVSFALPRRAPCDGVEGLSRTASAASHEVRLTDLSVELIEEAEAARRAKIAAARAARVKLAAAKAAKARRFAAASAKKRVDVASADR